MPASHANTIDRISLPASAPARAPAIEDFLPFIASMSAVAAVRSPSSGDLSSLSRIAATENETAPANRTDRVTPTRLDAGACSHTAMIEPGAAGARRPESKSRLVATPVMPPRITARTSFGFIRTYGK